MATTTRTINRSLRKDTRMLDYIYDENFIESSKRDRDRISLKAQARANNMNRVPVFRNMFSELPHYPRFQMKTNCQFPVHVTREWRSCVCRNRQSWIRYQTLNYDIRGRALNPNLAGRDVRSWNWDVSDNVSSVQSPRRGTPVSRHSRLSQSSTEDVYLKTVETQTEYRDSEAQTDPFSPIHVVPAGDAPELISLATLSFGKGLPAGLAEVQLIARLREKRVWEAMLNGIMDPYELEKRRRLMIMIEANEWLARQRQIESLQEARLEVMKKHLSQREEFRQKRTIKKLDKIWARKQKEKENKLKKIRMEHANAIRKILQRRPRVPRVSFERKIAKEYTNPSSQVYAPLTRLGSFVDRTSEMYVVTSKHLSTYQGLLELEASLPEFVFNPRVTQVKKKRASRVDVMLCDNSCSHEDNAGVNKLNQETETSVSNRRYQFERYIRVNEFVDISEHSSTSSRSEVSHKSGLKQLQTSFQINQNTPRPGTPDQRKSQNIDETVPLAVTLIQQIIRGRSVQNKMLEGKETHRDLIGEVKATLLFDHSTNQRMKEHMESLTSVLQNNRTDNEHKDSTVNQILQELESKSVGECLDFLSKELIRLEEERRIHAFAIMCERQRQQRELAEGRVRQQEGRRRGEEDEILKEIMQTHQCSVNGYLDQLISTTLDQTADDQSKREIETQADSINQLAHYMEKYRDKIMSEEIAADLVHSFLIPEAKKQFIREKVRQNQRRFLMAAHSEIYLESSFCKYGSEDNTSPSSEHDREEGNTSPLSEHGSGKHKTSLSLEHGSGKHKTSLSLEHGSGKHKTSLSSEYGSGKHKTSLSSEHDMEGRETSRFSVHDSTM